jgi:elongation factor P--(R)-beta-lysine ligase
VPKNAEPWRPRATIDTLRRRARILREIRCYFVQAGVLEVETPLLMPCGSPDPALHSFVAQAHSCASGSLSGFLQTSPEFAMKRLLAAGSGDIYQVCHAFRVEESGRHHLAEFTLLEWYRLGFDHHRLMDEVEALVTRVLPDLVFARASYGELFRQRIGIDPHTAAIGDLAAAAAHHGLELGAEGRDRATLIDALFAASVLRDRPRTEALFVYDFPREHAAYARIDPGPPPVAQRFELLIGGVEIANGYFEVVDRAEQEARHGLENARRRRLGSPEIDPDPLFLAALAHGMPECAGVALGIERLVMLGSGQDAVSLVVSFDDFAAE